MEIFCKRIPSLEQKRILSCSYGWLVLYDFPNQLFSLCNCTTFDTTPLRKLCLGPPNMINSCILSSSPNSPDCKVLLFLKNRQSIMWCYVWDNTWREIENPKRFCFSHPVMCRGKIYASLRGQLWSIEIFDGEQEQIIWSKLHAARLREEYEVEEYVVESDGDLYSISFIMANRNFVAVDFRKLSWDSMDWEIVDSLRNRSFFICPDYWFSCSTPGHDLIFLIKSGDVNIYTYNMEEDSLSVTKIPPQQHTLSRSIWMTPQVLVSPADHCNQEEVEHRSLDMGMEGDEKNNLVKTLPFDIILEQVRQHLLSPHDYLNIRSLNRMWRSVTPLVNWRNTLSGSKSHDPSFPLHMFAVKCRSLYRFVHPQQNSARSYLMTIPECLKNYNVLYSNHGWVLMGMRRPRASDIHLYNPFTRDIKTYPSLGDASSVLFFASKPSFMLIGISFFPTPWVSILEPAGKNVWTRSYVNAFPGIRDFRARAKSPSPVFFKGAFYSLNKSGNLARLYLNGEKFRWEVVVNVVAPCRVRPENFLVECGGALLSVFVGHMGKRIYVFKLNISKRIWETVKSLNCYNFLSNLRLSP